MNNEVDTYFLSDEENNNEYIPLITAEDEDNMANEETPEVLPILPLRNTVLFPGVVIPITVGRDRSIRLIQDANAGTKTIGVVAQRNADMEDPSFEDLHHIGTQATILRMLRMPDGSTTVILQGKKRFSIQGLVNTDPYFEAQVSAFEEINNKAESKEQQALFESLRDHALNIINLSPDIPSEAALAIKNISGLSFLTNFISSNMKADVEKKQELLEIADLDERAKKFQSNNASIF
jgi:ATP-dependent Lon protease